MVASASAEVVKAEVREAVVTSASEEVVASRSPTVVTSAEGKKLTVVSTEVSASDAEGP